MAKLSKKNKMIIWIVAVVVVLVAAWLVADAVIRSQKHTEAVKREAKSVLSIYQSTVISNALKTPSDDQITDMVPTNAKTITTIATSGEPTTDTAVLKVGEKCDGSADSSKTAAAVHILLPNKSQYCAD